MVLADGGGDPLHQAHHVLGRHPDREAALAATHQDLVKRHGGVIEYGWQQLLLGQRADAPHLVTGQLLGLRRCHHLHLFQTRGLGQLFETAHAG